MSKAKDESKALVVTQQQGHALAQLDDEALGAYAVLAGQGAEQATAADMQMPMLNLLQSLSPQKNKRDPKYIDGAEEGDFFNTVSKELYKGTDGMTVIHVWFKKAWIEWRPREVGGGFVRSYDNVADANEQTQPGNSIEETANHYVLVLCADGEFKPALLSMSRSKLGVSRNWVSRMKDVRLKIGGKVFTPPTYAKYYIITSEQKQGKNNSTYFTPKVEEGGYINPRGEVFAMAEELFKQLSGGTSKLEVNYNAAAEADFTVEDAPSDDKPAF